MNLQALRNSEFISERSFGHISSFNFTRKAFQSGIWNDITTKARGLFLDNRTGRVVARAYNKFFNVGERPETSLKSLKENLRFPVRAYKKENGFLGIMSLDPVSGDVLYCTKSMVSGGAFNEIFEGVCKEVFLRDRIDFELLTKTMAAYNVSLVFEVVDPVNDPHIIEYEKPQLYLLDAVFNTDDFRAFSYEDLRAIAAEAGIPCKQLIHTYTSWDELETDLERIKSVDYQCRGEYIEGFVLQDAVGFMFKIKTGFYKKWKHLRAALPGIVKSNVVIHPERYTAEEQDILAKMIAYVNQTGMTNIVAVRRGIGA